MVWNIYATIAVMLGLLIPIMMVLATLHLFYPEEFKAQYRIRRTFAPLYRRIEEQYGPESYPAIMSHPYCEYFDLSRFDHWKYVFFKRDSSFVIMNIHDGSIKGEIPFDSIVCTYPTVSSFSKRWRLGSVDIYFKVDNETQKFCFNALKYNQTLNKNFDAQYNGKNLYDFISTNFVHYRDIKYGELHKKY